MDSVMYGPRRAPHLSRTSLVLLKENILMAKKDKFTSISWEYKPGSMGSTMPSWSPETLGLQ